MTLVLGGLGGATAAYLLTGGLGAFGDGGGPPPAKGTGPSNFLVDVRPATGFVRVEVTPN